MIKLDANSPINQIGGEHYNHPYQAITLIVQHSICYTGGCILKYLVRAHAKGKVEDIRKAISLVPAYKEQLLKGNSSAVPSDTICEFLEANRGYIHPASIYAITELCKANIATDALEVALQNFLEVLDWEVKNSPLTYRGFNSNEKIKTDRPSWPSQPHFIYKAE